ncbi:hypothetical protein FRB99_006405 [Tulasnella sp. 403]|nr:hypothetical protein FRB99_006405 [Tulasnella sp. 403]
MSELTLSLSPATTPFPFTILVLASYVSANLNFDVEVKTPVLRTRDGEVTDLEQIVATLSTTVGQGESTKHASFVALAKSLSTLTAYPDVLAALDLLDDHLAYRTFLVGHAVTSADLLVWGAMKSNSQVLGILKRNQHVHLSRWYSYVENLPTTQRALTSLTEAKANKARSTKTATSFNLGLPGAVEGQVITRFPPEPSGYLHIGHAKAAILNQQFASMYKGKLIIRFDDTNPAKEKEEFENTILEDLKLMDIRGDRFTHTSDYFQELHDLCVQMIKTGIRRRGLTVEALKQYMLSQGPSQATIMLEWDGIWATNKKIIDPVAPRYWALEKKDIVKVTIEGAGAVEVKTLPLHKKNPDVGEKSTVYGPDIYLEQEDAASLEDNEEVTLMDWGNAIVKSKTTSGSGVVESITVTLHLEGDFKKTKKKLTWLAVESLSNTLTPVTLLDYDYLITKKKLEENDSVADVVTPQTEFKTDCLADANVAKQVKKGDIIQFERKGYYICDQVGDGTHGFEFVKIPDGRVASLASKATPGAATPADSVDAGSKPKAVAKGGWGKSGPPTGVPSGNTTGKGKVPASSADPNENVMLSEGSRGFPIPVTTKMYPVQRVGGPSEVVAEADTKMYKVPNIYDVQ